MSENDPVWLPGHTAPRDGSHFPAIFHGSRLVLTCWMEQDQVGFIGHWRAFSLRGGAKFSFGPPHAPRAWLKVPPPSEEELDRLLGPEP